MVDVYSVLSSMMTTQKKILPAGGAFNPSSFLSQSPDFLKSPLKKSTMLISHWDRYLGMMTAMTQVPVFYPSASYKKRPDTE